MISPYKLSATRDIVDLRLPIADCLEPSGFFEIGNWKLAIGNVSPVADGLL
jgi:hypothetical protein